MKKVYHVYRSTKTRKTVVVGDFETLAEAQEAMLAHYKSTPKRGKFWYVISEDNLREIDGVMFRETCYDGQTYHKTFQMDELNALAEAE